MNCPICSRRWNYESALLEHIIEKHFYRPRGRRMGEPLLVMGKLVQYFNYSLICWCDWNAFANMCPPFIRSDFSMAKIAAALHLERSGGAASHWLQWRLENMNVRLPPRLQFGRQTRFTTEGGIATQT